MLTQLQGISKDQRTARFRCVLVFMRNAQDPSPIITEGTWNGFILEQPYGEHGFGYDPIFWSPENKCSAAEITPEEKSRISHRAQAISLMAERLNLD